MKLRHVLVLLGLSTIQACDNTEPLPVAFFTAAASNDYLDYFHYDDIWVFATDENGNVLDAQPLTPGATVKLATANPPGTFNLTIYYFTESSAGLAIHRFTTYGGIANGSVKTFEAPQNVSEPSILGLATISLENCTPSTFFSISDGYDYYEDYTFDETTKNSLRNVREGYTEVLVSTRTAIDRPVYGWIDNVVGPGTFTFDMNDLVPFPNTVSVSHTGAIWAQLFAYESDLIGHGFAMAVDNFNQTSGPAEVIKLGYLGGFDSYSLDLYAPTQLPTFDRYSFYSKAGSVLPSSVTLPNNTFEITDNSMKSFAFAYSSPFTYSIHDWGKNAGSYTMSWAVYSGSNAIAAITKLPETLTARYPSLSLDNMAHQRSYLYNYVDGYTYEKLLNELFGAQPSATHDYYTDQFVPR